MRTFVGVIVLAILVVIMLAIECGYIQYGFGRVHFEHPNDYQHNSRGICSL